MNAYFSWSFHGDWIQYNFPGLKAASEGLIKTLQNPVASSTSGFILMMQSVSERRFIWSRDAAISARRLIYPMEQLFIFQKLTVPQFTTDFEAFEDKVHYRIHRSPSLRLFWTLLSHGSF